MKPAIAELLAKRSPSELVEMERRAWYEAARSWQEARAATDPAARRVLFDAARSAEAYWRTVRDAAHEARP